MGYQIILWNYRGYGQSTGTPSISNSLDDAQSIYNYTKEVLHLETQIIHGYSIGGPPGVSLALSQRVKNLVVDRTFCNFVNIAEEISPILAKIAKIIMRADSNIKISDLYLEIKGCRKIMIWAPLDQVVSHGSSLKLGVLENAYRRYENRDSNSENSPNSTPFQEQLAQMSQFKEEDSLSNSQSRLKIEGTGKVDKWVKKLIYFFDVLNSHSAQKSTNKEQKSKELLTVTTENENHFLIEDLPVMQTQKLKEENKNKIGAQNEILSKFWEIIGNLDGAGTTINFLKQLTKQNNEKSNELHLEVRSFVLGLSFYGCCFKLNGQFQQNGVNKTDLTLQNLNKVLQSLNILLEEHRQKCTTQLMDYLKIFTTLLAQIKIHIEKSNKNIRKQFGIILPTNCGHNGQLTKIEMQHLKNILKINPQEMLCQQ